MRAKRPALPYDLFFDAVPQSHWRFFRSLVPSHRSEECLSVHGGVDPRVPRIEDQTRESMIWGGDGFPGQYRSAGTLFCGRRNNAALTCAGWPVPGLLGRTVGLDSISRGVLTAMRFPDRRVLQSARCGEPGAGPCGRD